MLSVYGNLRRYAEIIRLSVFFILTFIVYVTTPNVSVWWGDTFASRFLPISIIREGNFDLNEFDSTFNKELPYFLQYRNNRLISFYPVGAALTAAPFYLVPVLLGISHESPWIPLLERVSAASITLLSALFLYLALRQLTTKKTALIVTAIYALCTSAFSISSQALWQHGPSQFWLALGLYFLIRGLFEEHFIPWSGFPLSAAIICRPTDLLMVLPVLAYLGFHKRKFLLWWIVCALPPAAFLLIYNYQYFGSIFELGYGTGVLHPFSGQWSAPFVYGLLGVLVSPSKGLFIYSPILLFSLLGIYSIWRTNRDPLLKYLSLGPIFVLLLYSKWYFWWGGETYGPRLVADITPFLCLFLYPAWESIAQRRFQKITFISIAIISLLMHAIGAFGFDNSWHQKGDVTVEGDRFWSLQDSPFMHFGKRLFLKNISFLRTGFSKLPTSAQMPHELAATLVHDEIPRSYIASAPIKLPIVAKNTGPAIWLFQTNNGQAGVSLGWRWLKAEDQVPYSVGILPLTRDVFPGEQEELYLETWPPSLEGQYILELGMISELTTWFAVERIPVQIVGSCNFSDLVGKPLKFVQESPHTTIAPDKASYLSQEIANVRLGVANGGIPRNLRRSVLLQYPDGHLRSLSPAAEMTSNPSCSHWIPITKIEILSKVFKHDLHFGLRLRDMPIGLYTLYTFLTEPDNTEVIARSSSSFNISSDHE